ncbi:MAG: transposase [Arsenophonus sp.]
MHTYARQLNQHLHVHLSIICGCLDLKHALWCKLFFKK